ncbi:SDR family NAD(P)-dependent oxidoreductase [Frankia sp. Cppng1_Ct_nod]|uniref:SDR family NAD(P)-dependent oxidoreductase n=1 Tax=Frankia sp. Cppng1_Ct_nod TaxID=2897162 RepID=UPI0010415AD6|nr:SDR family NAD(P)-dependent oxidoreductase [Frankia sp. Cppng1_Ct_nod]
MLTGRVALVTGAGRGLGAAHARLLAAEGAAVVVNDVGASLDGRTSGEQVAADVVADITAVGGRAVADTCDISTFAGAAAAVRRVVDTFGRIDILVNNAGIMDTSGVEDLAEDSLDRVLDVHVKGSVATTRAAFAYMRTQAFGRIINTISESALDMRMADSIAYSSAKAAVWGLTMATAKNGAPYGITANAVSPGARTRMSAGVLDAGMSTGLDLAPEHVSRVVVLLASPGAGDITGRVVHAAAGQVREYILRRTADTDLVRRLADGSTSTVAS